MFIRACAIASQGLSISQHSKQQTQQAPKHVCIITGSAPEPSTAGCPSKAGSWRGGGSGKRGVRVASPVRRLLGADHHQIANLQATAVYQRSTNRLEYRTIRKSLELGVTRRCIMSLCAPRTPRTPVHATAEKFGVPQGGGGLKTDENAAQGPACGRVSRTLTSVRGDTRIMGC